MVATRRRWLRADINSALRFLVARLAAEAGITTPAVEANPRAGDEEGTKAGPASGPPGVAGTAAAARLSAVAVRLSAVAAATWAFMRQRVSAPRDMSSAASLDALAGLDF